MAMLDHALELARKGFRVFPLQENSKLPAIKDWPAKATTNEKQISKWWSEHPLNIGVATGQGIIVFDYDMKEGQQGQRALDTHDMLGLPMDSFKVETPSGGIHLYFKTQETVHNSVSKVARNVDVRGHNGYVVGPGSVINDKSYRTFDAFAPIHEAPTWALDFARTKRTKLDAKEQLGTSWDTEENITRAKDYLINDAPEAISGVNGNNTTYKVACVLKDMKISPSESMALMLEHWNPRLDEQWEPGELEPIVASAHKTGSLPAGIADPKGEFGDSDVSRLETGLETKGDKPKKPKVFFIPPEEAVRRTFIKLGDPLVTHLLDRSGLSAVYGKSSEGKTFVELDIAFHVAAGRPWNGHAVAQGLVVYVAAEGGRGIYKRFAALQKHYGWDGNLPMVLVPCPVNLMDTSKQADTLDLIRVVGEAEAEYGQKAALIVIDTVSRALAGGDENSSTDMGTFIRNVDKIRSATGAHVSLVHHSGKDQARGMRGWSGIRAALDTEIEVNAGKITVTKQRDIEPIDPISFVLKIIDVGTSPGGDKVTSCVIDMSSSAVAAAEMGSLTEQEQSVYEIMVGMKDDKTRQNTPISNQELLQSCHSTLTTRELDKSNLQRVLSKLSDAGLIEKVQRGQWVVV